MISSSNRIRNVRFFCVCLLVKASRHPFGEGGGQWTPRAVNRTGNLIFFFFSLSRADKSIFGVSLSVTVQRSGESLPRPILQALHWLRVSALDQVGVFRKSGVRSRIAQLRDMCQQAGAQGQVDFTDQQPYDVADMVKQYFRELPEALLTNKLSETFVTIFQCTFTQNSVNFA